MELAPSATPGTPNRQRLVAERRLAKVSRRQHGLITTAQSTECGVSVDARRHRIRTGRWSVIAPGVVAVAGTPPTWKQRTMAAVLAAAPGAVASHTTAAGLFALSSCSSRAVEITVPRGRSHRSRLAKMHESVHLPPSYVTTVDHIPVTRPTRTLIDLAGCVPQPILEDAVDDALVRRLTTLERLERRMADRDWPSRPGSVVLRKVLRCWTEGEMAEEVAEMRLVRRLVAHGLPNPARQFDVLDGAGRLVARPDLAYPQERVAVELNGFRWHGTPRGYARDQARSRRLAALGWLILPATPLDLAEDGGALAEQVMAALIQSGAARRGA